MGYTREGIFVDSLWTSSKTPSDVPSVDEVGCTSAPLESMAFHFGSYCQEYTQDFSLCKAENADPEHCLKEGRRVTRCAIDLYVPLPCEETDCVGSKS